MGVSEKAVNKTFVKRLSARILIVLLLEHPREAGRSR
jgi:hypothetical protein